MNRLVSIAVASVCFACSAQQASSSETAAKGDMPPKMVTCVVPERDGRPEATWLWYLAAHEADGTAYYRTISAQLNEIIVKPDGTIESMANPCDGALTFIE